MCFEGIVGSSPPVDETENNLSLAPRAELRDLINETPPNPIGLPDAANILKSVMIHGGKNVTFQKTPVTSRRGKMKAVIIYDDVATAARSIAILRRASSLANVSAGWNIKPWRVDLLNLQMIAEEALLEALDANIIVLADLCASRLPIWLKDWLECWGVRRQPGESALVVTHDNPDAEPSAMVIDELLGFAAQHKLDLIVETNAPVWTEPLSTGVGSDSSNHASCRNWGINE